MNRIPLGTRVIVALPDEGEFTGVIAMNQGMDTEYDFQYRVTLDDGMWLGANQDEITPEG